MVPPVIRSLDTEYRGCYFFSSTLVLVSVALSGPVNAEYMVVGHGHVGLYGFCAPCLTLLAQPCVHLF